MYEVSIERQFRAMREMVFNLASIFEGANQSEFVRTFPAFIIGSCYNMLSENKELHSPMKAVLLDHAIKISFIKFELSGFEIILALEGKRGMTVLSDSFPDFCSDAEAFWRTLCVYTKKSGQKEILGNFLLMFRIYMQAITDDLNFRNPSLHLSASSYFQNLERL